MRRIQVTREMAEWLTRKLGESSAFLLTSVQGAELVLRVLPKLEARASADADIMLELDDGEFELLAKASQPRTRLHTPQELMLEARCRSVFLRTPAAELAAIGPVAQTASAPEASPEVSGVRGHSGFGYGSQPYGMIANVPNLPPSMRPPTQAAPTPAAVVPAVQEGVTVLSPEQARAMGAKTAEELGLAPPPDDPLELERLERENMRAEFAEFKGDDVTEAAAALLEDTTPPPPAPTTRIGHVCVEILTRFGELAVRVPEVLPPPNYSSEARSAVTARRLRLRDLINLVEDLSRAQDSEAAFASAADLEQGLLDNLAELEREERAVLDELNAAAAAREAAAEREAAEAAAREAEQKAPDTERPATGVETVGIPSVRKL